MNKIKIIILLPLALLANFFASNITASPASQMAAFKNYKQQQQDEFAGYLKKQWQDFRVSKGLVRDKSPKPKHLPKIKQKLTKTIAKKTAPKTKLPPTNKNLNPNPTKKYNFNNYKVVSLGKTATIPVAKKWQKISTSYKNSNISIANAWDKMSKIDNKQMLNNLQKVKNNTVNDWELLEITDHLSKKVFSDASKQKLFMWFAMVKLGYKVRIAYQKNNLFILYASNQQVYGTSFLTIAGQKFYFWGKKSRGKLKSYDRNIDKNLASINFIFNKFLVANQNPKNNYYAFKVKGTEYKISVPIKTKAVYFMDRMPLLNLSWYTHKNNKSEGYLVLLTQLQAIINNKWSKPKQAQFVLNFVQSLPYQTDGQQFGFEKYMLPDQTIFYKSDCEDRAALYVNLVKDMLNVKAVMLLYPGHVSSAVALNGTKGKKISIGGISYTHADPSYIGAKLGVAMPKFKHQKPKIL